MNRMIKLTDAKVPPQFKTAKSKRKNDTKSLGINSSKRQIQNQVTKSTGQPAKRRRKCNNADSKSDGISNFEIRGQKYKSEVQLELDRLNNQLKWVRWVCYLKIQCNFITVILIKICRARARNYVSNIIMVSKSELKRAFCPQITKILLAKLLLRLFQNSFRQWKSKFLGKRLWRWQQLHIVKFKARGK